ncbi:hypothetical protein D9M70_605090 [compost metagenome]
MPPFPLSKSLLAVPARDVPGFGIPGRWIIAGNVVAKTRDVSPLDERNDSDVADQKIIHRHEKSAPFLRIDFRCRGSEQRVVIITAVAGPIRSRPVIRLLRGFGAGPANHVTAGIGAFVSIGKFLQIRIKVPSRVGAG